MPRSKPRTLWSPPWEKAPAGTIGASFNPDGNAWWWSVKPSICGSEKRPWDRKWRGPSYGEGYTDMNLKLDGVHRAMWEHSYVEKPKNG